MGTLRKHLKLLEAENELLTIEEEVDPCFEITAILQEVSSHSGGPAILFNNLKGYPGRKVVGNILASQKKIALALNADEEKLKEGYLAGREKSIDPKVLKSGPVQEQVISEEIDLLSILPAPFFHEGDAGNYLTAAVLTAKDPDTGIQNTGIHRVQIKEGNRLGVLLANPPLSDYLAKAEKKGEKLPIAVTLGWHPAEFLGAVVPLKEGIISKLNLAGGLKGQPVELVPAREVDLLVPAKGEIVLEGHIIPGVREKEGPFGESSGYYFEDRSPVVEVTTVTHRHDYILPIIQPWGLETEMILSVCSGAETWRELKKLMPGVVDVGFLPGVLTFQGVISVSSEMSREEIRRLISLALSLERRLKHVIVVDEDVNVHNPREVLWALGTRFQAQQDIITLTGVEGYVIDPSARGGTGSKMGLDATGRPGGPKSDKFKGLSIPEESKQKAKEILHKRGR